MPAYRIPDNVISQSVANETVLLDLDQGAYFGLDAIGTRMVELLRTQPDHAAVVEVLAGEYDAPRPTLRRDLEALIQRLEESGLIARDE